MASRVYGHPALEENLTSEAAVKLVQECTDVQHMIDINSEHLDRLRTPMNSTSGRQISGKYLQVSHKFEKESKNVYLAMNHLTNLNV